MLGDAFVVQQALDEGPVFLMSLLAMLLSTLLQNAYAESGLLNEVFVLFFLGLLSDGMSGGHGMGVKPLKLRISRHYLVEMIAITLIIGIPLLKGSFFFF